jgi:hypothetical protein
MWHSSLLSRLPDAPSNFIHNDIVMRRIATQQAANTNDRVVLFRLSKHSGRRRNLERAGNPREHDIFLSGARPQQSIVGAKNKSLCDKGIEAGNNNGKPLSLSAEAALNSRNSWLRWPFDFYFLFRDFLRACESALRSFSLLQSHL